MSDFDAAKKKVIALTAEVERVKAELDQCHRIHQPAQHIRAIKRAQVAELRAEKAEAELIDTAHDAALTQEAACRNLLEAARLRVELATTAAELAAAQAVHKQDGIVLADSYQRYERLRGELAAEREGYEKWVEERERENDKALAETLKRIEASENVQRERAERLEKALGRMIVLVNGTAATEELPYKEAVALLHEALRPAAPDPTPSETRAARLEKAGDVMAVYNEQTLPWAATKAWERAKYRAAPDPTPSEEVMPDAGRRNSSSDPFQVVTGGGASGDHTPTERPDLPPSEESWFRGEVDERLITKVAAEQPDLPLGHPYKGSGIIFKGETQETDSCVHEAQSKHGIRVCHQPESAHRRKP